MYYSLVSTTLQHKIKHYVYYLCSPTICPLKYCPIWRVQCIINICHHSSLSKMKLDFSTMIHQRISWVQILCATLFLNPIFAEWNTRDYIRREHSLTKPYQGEWPRLPTSTSLWSWKASQYNIIILNYFVSGSGMSLPYWDFLGSTIVTSNYVRLTPDLQSKAGALWNTVVSSTYIVT